MDTATLLQWKDLGMAGALGLAAVGSGLGAGVAGMAACGAWKKCLMQGKPAPFILIAFVGAPLTQTIYGMIIMNAIAGVAAKGSFLWSIGLLGGLANGVSAWMQGATGAAAADAMGETGKGMGNYLIAIGIVETVALFVMVFSLMAIGKFAV